MHLKMQMVARTDTRIICHAEEFSLLDEGARLAQFFRDAVLSQVQVKLVGERGGRAIFQDDEIGTFCALAAVGMAPNGAGNKAAFGGMDIEKRAGIARGGEIEGEVGAAAGGVAVMAHALRQAHGVSAFPGQQVAA